ncbi:WXG100 family type VII secretion target [Mycolicibacterium komossense]|uniref:WXG100 family type VII secretion target n=1 Tax=Mycolicibacterium komossense TaxID=1779 RepID=A0ABT3C8S0_9MYCO|nr:WXG100 family type VII secretion target [Mycolicibacterium komossense]MCV7225880.1 WXG100 family type VII secretion target [Mycolicibacterium komossense]
MADKLFVDPEGLRTSAVQVQSHSDDLAIGHTTANTRVSSASGGWSGQSAQSLNAWATKLKTQSAALVTKIDNHSRQMHTAVHTFTSTEEQRANELTKIGQVADAVQPPSSA